MKYYLNIILLTIAVFTLLFACEEQQEMQDYPAPVQTIVNINNEEGEENTMNRELWMEGMHLTAPGQNWRNIERKNSVSKIQKDLERRSGETVNLGGNLYRGEWSEKGSNNQAGSVVAINYDKANDDIYTISAGGTLWKGKRDGSSWEVINQSYRFDNKTLFFLNMGEDKIRMIANVARIPHYSDDMGLTWSSSTGVTSNGDFWSFTQSFESIEYQGANRIYCLSKRNYGAQIFLYASDDNGETYQEINSMGERDLRRVRLLKPNNSNQILIAKPYFSQSTVMSIHELHPETNTLELLVVTDLETNLTNRMILLADFAAQDTLLYAFDKNLSFYSSKNMGRSWEFLSNSSVGPWEVGCFMSPSDREQVFLGAVEAYRLKDNAFQMVNNWWEYYDNVESAIHADMMSFEEFESPDGRIFQLIGNHGGMSISYDYLKTLQNIGLEGLNVAEYYDVRTDPIDPNTVYAGSQDQGFQRTRNINAAGPVDFQQVISGDYGHITFSNDGEGMWIVYPGGSVSFYSDPRNGYRVGSYTIDSPNESNWLTPMTEIPGSTNNEILVAGGSINPDDPGSYIIKMSYNNGIQTEELPHNFGFSRVLSAIEVSPINENLIYASTSNGLFYYSRDKGQTFEIGTNYINNGHYLYGTSIYASRINENEVWVAGSGYNNNGIFYSDDYGQSFSLFTEDLPSTLVFEITANADETQFFAATEAGPYIYLSETGKWEDLSQGNVPVNTYWSVEYLEATKTARFGTYGRGIFDFVFMDPLPDEDNDGVADVDDACPGFDDNIDSDGDGIPDGCDLCDDVSLIINTEGDNCGESVALSAAVNSGAGAIEFIWSTGETSSTISVLTSGTYFLTITDENNCTVTESIVVEFTPSLKFDLVVNDPIVCERAGEIDLQISGGIPPYTYEYNGTTIDLPYESSDEGNYDFSIRDANNCMIDTSIFLLDNSYALEVDDPETVVKCLDDEDFTFQVEIGAYEIIWDNGITTNEITNASEGVYTYTLTDEFGCIGMSSVTVIESEPLTIDLDISNAINGQNGSVIATASSNSMSITWSTGDIGPEINNLEPGDYSVTVTDEFNCEIVENFTIENEMTSSVDFTSVLNFDVVPNPAREYLSVSLSMNSAIPYELKIVDILGREIWSTQDNKITSSYSVDLSNVDSGTYYCIFTSKEIQKLKKLILLE